MPQKTHTEVKKPQMSISRLADYMAASEQAKRTIVQSCKYRSTARVVQHNDAKAIVSNFIRSGSDNTNILLEKANSVRNKISDDDFDADVNDHNADYIERFAEVYVETNLPAVEYQTGKKFPALVLNGVTISFVPQLLLGRTTKTNKIRSGALMLRYAKGKALPALIGNYQSAAVFGYLRVLEEQTQSEAEKALCLTLDAYTGDAFEAPGNAVYLFNEMKAACASISERWPAIKPPKNAVF